MSYSRNHSRLTRRHFDKNFGRITIRYVDPNKKLTLYGKYDPNWEPKIKDHIEVCKDLVKRGKSITAGWRGHITQIREENNKKQYLCAIYNIHETVFLERKDFNQYFTKEERQKMNLEDNGNNKKENENVNTTQDTQRNLEP